MSEPTDPIGVLVQRAQFLRNAAPVEWDHFKTALATYGQTQTNNAVDATSNIKRAQGVAQGHKKLLQLLDRIK